MACSTDEGTEVEDGPADCQALLADRQAPCEPVQVRVADFGEGSKAKEPAQDTRGVHVDERLRLTVNHRQHGTGGVLADTLKSF